MTMSPAERQPATDAAISVEKWSATSGSDRPSRANLILSGGGHRWRANASGNGAIDALLRAVDNALEPVLGEGVVLAAYEVHAAGVGHEAKASITVGVRRADAPDGPIYPGRALHDSVLHASLEGYVDAINQLLADEGVDVGAAKPSPGDTNRHQHDPDHRSASVDRMMSIYNS